MKRGFKPPVPDRLWRVLWFVLWFSLLGVVARLLVWERLDYNLLQHATISLVFLFLFVLGYNVSVLGNIILARSGSTLLLVEIIPDCTGWKAMTALACLVLATPGRSLVSKLWGVAVLVPLGFFLNSVRLATTIIISLYLGSGVFSLVHDVLWQVVMLFLVFGLWFAWYKTAPPEDSRERGRKAHEPGY